MSNNQMLLVLGIGAVVLLVVMSDKQTTTTPDPGIFGSGIRIQDITSGLGDLAGSIASVI